MAIIYATLIVKGKKTYAQVPEKIKPQVKQVLIDLECEDLITEESIRSLFLDFFHSLPESNLVYSKEDTLYLLKHHINQLEASIKTK